MQYIAECDGGLCRQGSGDRLSLCRGFTAGAPMSRRYPVEGAPGPSLLGTGVLGGPGFHPGAQSSQRRDRASGSC